MTTSPQSYVRTLPTEVQTTIFERLLAVPGLTSENIEDAMDSRLCDLSDVINIADLTN